MELHRHTAENSSQPPESTFTGDIAISGYFQRNAPSRLSGAVATYAPGARTPWKRNASGQTLVVTSGVGRAAAEGEGVIEIRAGDLVWFAPGQWHWDGAAPDQEMTYVAVQEGGVEFGSAVTDEEYAEAPRGT